MFFMRKVAMNVFIKKGTNNLHYISGKDIKSGCQIRTDNNANSFFDFVKIIESTAEAPN